MTAWLTAYWIHILVSLMAAGLCIVLGMAFARRVDEQRPLTQDELRLLRKWYDDTH
jgi:hypothetical protein